MQTNQYYIIKQITNAIQYNVNFYNLSKNLNVFEIF